MFKLEKWILCSDEVLAECQEREQRRRWGERIFNVLAKGVKIEGQEKIPLPPYIVAFNHMAWAEAAVLYFYFPHRISFFTKKENLEKPLLGKIFSGVDLIPVLRKEVDRLALRKAITHLKREGVLGIAPEGTRGRGEQRRALKEGKKGIFYIAARAQAPIVPVAIWGSEDILPLIDEPEVSFRERFLHFKRKLVKVRIGNSFAAHLDSAEFVKGQQLKIWAEELMVAIGQMLPEDHRGFYRQMIEKRGSGEGQTF